MNCFFGKKFLILSCLFLCSNHGYAMKRWHILAIPTLVGGIMIKSLYETTRFENTFEKWIDLQDKDHVTPRQKEWNACQNMVWNRLQRCHDEQFLFVSGRCRNLLDQELKKYPEDKPN